MYSRGGVCICQTKHWIAKHVTIDIVARVGEGVTIGDDGQADIGTVELYRCEIIPELNVAYTVLRNRYTVASDEITGPLSSPPRAVGGFY